MFHGSDDKGLTNDCVTLGAFWKHFCVMIVCHLLITWCEVDISLLCAMLSFLGVF